MATENEMMIETLNTLMEIQESSPEFYRLTSAALQALYDASVHREDGYYKLARFALLRAQVWTQTASLEHVVKRNS